jgi:hypothetical protein
VRFRCGISVMHCMEQYRKEATIVLSGWWS